MHATNRFKHALWAASLALAGLTAHAEEMLPSVEIEARSVSVGLSGSSGEGTLTLANLGADCRYGFKVDGFGAGVAVGVTKVSAHGLVKNLHSLEHFAGKYDATGASATLFKGQGVIDLKNEKSGVGMELESKTEGIGLGVDAQGMTIEMKEPIPNPPREYVVYFGVNRHDLDDDGRAVLRKVAADWRCRYPDLKLVGHTDTTGNPDYNLALSKKRATSVESALVEAGIRADRVSASGVGQEMLLKNTAEGVRSDLNRAVVVTIQ